MQPAQPIDCTVSYIMLFCTSFPASTHGRAPRHHAVPTLVPERLTDCIAINSLHAAGKQAIRSFTQSRDRHVLVRVRDLRMGKRW